MSEKERVHEVRPATKEGFNEANKGLISIDNGQPVVFAPPSEPEAPPLPQAQQADSGGSSNDGGQQ